MTVRKIISVLMALLLIVGMVGVLPAGAGDERAEIIKNMRIAKPSVPYLDYHKALDDGSPVHSWTMFYYDVGSDVLAFCEEYAKLGPDAMTEKYGMVFSEVEIQIDAKFDNGEWLSSTGNWDRLEFDENVYQNNLAFLINNGFWPDDTSKYHSFTQSWLTYYTPEAEDCAFFRSAVASTVDEYGEPVYYFDLDNHTITYRIRYAITYTIPDFEGEYNTGAGCNIILSDWSDAVSIGKNGNQVNLTEPEVLDAPSINSLSLDIAENGDINGYFYLDVPKSVYDAEKYYIIYRDVDPFYIESQVRVKGGDWQEAYIGNGGWLTGGMRYLSLPDSVTSTSDAVQLRVRIVSDDYVSTGWSNVISCNVAETYTISFAAAGGTGEMSNVTVVKGNNYVLPPCSFYPPAGMEFDRWDIGAVNDVITPTADMTITAIWKEHVHTPVATDKVMPTCTEQGMEAGTACSVCGMTLSGREEIPKLGHNFEFFKKVESTCTTQGYSVYKCSRCGSTYDDDVQGLKDHKWDAGKVTKEATCTTDGQTTYTCTVCKKATYTEKIGKLGHSYKYVVTKATMTKNGKITPTCTRCGDKQTAQTIYKASNVSISKSTFVYNGKTQKASVTVNNSKGNAIGAPDATVTYAKKDSKMPGVYKITVAFDVHYSGTKTFTYKIVPRQVKDLKAATIKKDSIKITWTKLVEAKAYKVEYSIDSGKTWKATTVTTNSYTLAKQKAGAKIQFRVTALSAAKNGVAGKVSEVLKTGTLTAAPTVTLTSTKSKTATATWKKVTGAKKYVVYKSTDNKKWTKVTTTTKLTYTLTKLTGGKKIYVKVTAVNAYGKNGAASAVKSVKVKK